jgi:hypothetical protein
MWGLLPAMVASPYPSTGRWRPDVDVGPGSCAAGIQGVVGIVLATGDLDYLQAALDAGIESLRG